MIPFILLDGSQTSFLFVSFEKSSLKCCIISKQNIFHRKERKSSVDNHYSINIMYLLAFPFVLLIFIHPNGKSHILIVCYVFRTILFSYFFYYYHNFEVKILSQKGEKSLTRRCYLFCDIIRIKKLVSLFSTQKL